jgi:hypothetical protein
VVQTGCGYALGSIVLVTFPNPIAAGDMLVVWVVSRGDSTSLAPPDGTWTQVESYVILDPLGNFPGSDPAAMWYKIADSTEDGQTVLGFASVNGSSRPKALGWELAGVTAPTDSSSATLQSGAAGSLPAVTVAAGGISIAGIATRSDDPEPATLTPSDNSYVEAGDHFFATALGADKIHTGSGTQTWATAFTVSGGGGEWAGVAAFFPVDSSTSGDDAPIPGQPVPPTNDITPAADGSAVTFLTPYPYADLSLQVEVNGVDMERNVDFVETNPGTGEFTFTLPPPAGAEIWVWFQGA